MLDKIYDFISHLYAKVIAVIIPKETFYNIYSEGKTTWAFKLLVERLHRYILLRKKHREEFVLLVMDSVGEEERAETTLRLIEKNCPNQYVKLQYWRRSVIFKRILNIVFN